MAYKLSTETLIQISALDWLLSQHPDVYRHTFHIANERKCSPAYGKILQKMGVKRGVSDLFIAYPVINYSGCFIEIKAPLGNISKEQKAFTELMNSKGYFACFCFGLDEFISTIKWYLKS